MYELGRKWFNRGRWLVRAVTTLLLWGPYWLSGFVPRRSDLWVFGTGHQVFVDNVKYLFMHVSETRPDITAVWISRKRETVRVVRRLGFKAYLRNSPAGWWCCLRARYYFVMSYVSDINFFASRGSAVVNLWHGSPLKRIEFDIKKGPLAELFVSPALRYRLIECPHLYRRPDFVLSGSPYVSSYALSSAFRVPMERCLSLGYPRNDVLFEQRSSALRELRKLGNADLADRIERLAVNGSIVFFLPTWRDSSSNVSIDWTALNGLMRERGSHLIAKPHPNVSREASGLPGTEEFDRITILDRQIDIYPLLALTDVLLSDYSSVIFDFCLTGRPIILVSFDAESIERDERGFYLSISEIGIGKIVDTNEQLLAALRDTLADRSLSGYSEAAIDRFNSFRVEGASRRIADYFTQRQAVL